MRSFALPAAIVVALTACCAHAEAEPGTTAPTTTPAAQTDGLWKKIDPRLRGMLADKTAAKLRAIAQLRMALPPPVQTELESRGLRFLRLQPDYAHVEGDAEALLRLAARDEVARLSASGPIEKSRPPVYLEAP